MTVAFSFTQHVSAAGDELARIVDVLRGAKDWLERVELGQFLDGALEGRARWRELFDARDSIDHIGFILPGWAKSLVSRAATTGGFPLNHKAFPSALFARELGRLLGRRRLETQIFKAHGRTASNAVVAFEAFIPSGEAEAVDTWVARGACNHVALLIDDAERFWRIRDAFLGAKIAMSGFMYDRAVYLPGEDSTIMYFDLDQSEFPLRLELRVAGEQIDGD